MLLKLIKQDVEYKKCAEDIKNRLKNAGFDAIDEKDLGMHCQFKLIYSSKEVGHLRFYHKKDGSTTIDDSQIKPDFKESIRAAMNGYIKIEAFREGTISLGTRNLHDPALVSEVKKMLEEKFSELKDTGIKDQVFSYRLEGNNLIVSQYQAGALLFQGKATSFSDKVIREVDKLVQQNQRSLLLSRIKAQVQKEEYVEIEAALKSRQVTLNEYVSPKLYSFFSGCGSHLLQDGLTILQVIKEKNIQLKDYGSLLRNFAMLFEDFLIDWFIKLGVLNEDDFKLNVRESFVGRYINDPNILPQKFLHCYSRTKPKFVEKLKSAYQECRHDLLHADKFKYEPITSLEKANAKLRLIIECMEDCVNLF